MRNIFLFARREFLERVRTKAFLITTLLIPAMMYGFTVLPSVFMTRKAKENRRVVLVVPSQELAGPAEAELLKRGKETGYTYTVAVSSDFSDAHKAQLLKQTDKDEIQGYVWAPQSAIASGKVEYYTKSVSDFQENANVEQAVNRGVREQRMSARGVRPEEIDALLYRVDLDTKQVKNGGAGSGGGAAAFFLPFFMLMLMYITVLVYGMSVMRSILQEKTSKIFEVLLSSATATQLMAGKILGVGAVGILQLIIWGAIGAIGLGPVAAAMKAMGPAQLPSASSLVYFVVFFLLGYLLYSTMCAALGAMVSSEEEAQQLQFPIMMPLIISVIFATMIIRQPNSTMAVVLSLIPFCTPLTMFLRVMVQSVPAWQIALSIVLTGGTTIAMIWVCARIYRVGILMYGKRPTLPEIIKWVKYA